MELLFFSFFLFLLFFFFFFFFEGGGGGGRGLGKEGGLRGDITHPIDDSYLEVCVSWGWEGWVGGWVGGLLLIR